MFYPMPHKVILEKKENDVKTASGIYTTSKKNEVYTVAAVNDDSKYLNGKTVYLNNPPIHLEGAFYATHSENIIAYTE